MGHVISHLTQLRALQSPVRHAILAAMEQIGPCPVSQLARKLGVRAGSLYYHVHALVEASLLVECGERPTGTRPERLYDVVSRSLVIDPDKRSRRFLEELTGVYQALLRQTARLIATALRDPATIRSGPSANLRTKRIGARLGPAAVAELNRRLDDLTRFVRDNDEPEVDTYLTLTLVLCPTDSPQ